MAGELEVTRRGALALGVVGAAAIAARGVVPAAAAALAEEPAARVIFVETDVVNLCLREAYEVVYGPPDGGPVEFRIMPGVNVHGLKTGRWPDGTDLAVRNDGTIWNRSRWVPVAGGGGGV